MARTEPVMLELAPLPREQIGPFLLLGLPKEADQAMIDKHWSDRVKWARRNQLKISLEDVNWARDVINDKSRRLEADVASFNVDTLERQIETLVERYNSSDASSAVWQPLDSEKDLADYVPRAEVPTSDSVRTEITIPALAEEMPIGSVQLEQMVMEPLDPWNL